MHGPRCSAGFDELQHPVLWSVARVNVEYRLIRESLLFQKRDESGFCRLLRRWGWTHYVLTVLLEIPSQRKASRAKHRSLRSRPLSSSFILVDDGQIEEIWVNCRLAHQINQCGG